MPFYIWMCMVRCPCCRNNFSQLHWALWDKVCSVSEHSTAAAIIQSVLDSLGLNSIRCMHSSSSCIYSVYIILYFHLCLYHLHGLRWCTAINGQTVTGVQVVGGDRSGYIQVTVRGATGPVCGSVDRATASYACSQKGFTNVISWGTVNSLGWVHALWLV